MSAGYRSDWLRWYVAPPEPAFRLVCLPPAGSAASFFRKWAAAVLRDIALAAVQYPGRENRLSEPPAASVAELADAIAASLRIAGGAPIVLFGHSLGAIVACETAARLDSVTLLAVAGCAPPRRPSDRQHAWDDDAIIADLQRLGGPNIAALDQPALRAIVMPALRADYQLSERYVPLSMRLTCDILALQGTDDTEVTASEMAEWQTITAGRCRVELVDGTHFFPQQHADEVVGKITDAIARVAPR